MNHKAFDFKYDKDSLKSLYQAWYMLPACNLMAAIGGAIQDMQAMQSAISEATARAERAEAELKAAREQEPVAWRVRGQLFRFNSDAVLFHSMNTVCGGVVEKLYASPIPAPAAQVPQNATCKHPLQVPAEWREVLSGLVAIAEKKGKKQGSPNHCHQRPGIWDDDNGPALSGKPCAECAMYDKARALIQQSEVKS